MSEASRIKVGDLVIASTAASDSLADCELYLVLAVERNPAGTLYCDLLLTSGSVLKSINSLFLTTIRIRRLK